VYIIRTGNTLSKVFSSQEEITTHLADSSPPVILSLTEAPNGVLTMIPIAKLILTLALLDSSPELSLPSSPVTASVIHPPDNTPQSPLTEETSQHSNVTPEEPGLTEDPSFESLPKTPSVPLEKKTVILPKTPVSTRRLGKVTTIKTGVKK
jgi:hypothetical protein